MGWMRDSAAEASRQATAPATVLERLLGMYAEERRIYREVLALSRRQGELVGRGASLAEVRNLLEEKRDCLDGIARLELSEHEARCAWEDGRDRWSGEARARLHQALQEIGGLIEEILQCEERNDMLLLRQAGPAFAPVAAGL